MYYLADLVNSTVRDKILLHANLLERQHGIMHVVVFQRLIVGKPAGQRLEFNAIGGKRWCGLQEPERWTDLQRKKSPYDRLTPATCLAAEFRQLDIIPTSNGSRFLSLKRTCSNNLTHMHVPAYKNCLGAYYEASVVAENLKDLSNYLDEFLPRLGVPREDVYSIKNHIIHRVT